MSLLENKYTLNIRVYRDGCPESMVDISLVVNSAHRHASWGPLVSQVKQQLEISDLDGIYTEYEGTPVHRIASLVDGAVYIARPTEDCALVRSILIDKENKERIPAYKHIERARLARLELKARMEEYNLESASSAGEGGKATASDNGEIAKSKSEQGLLDLAAEEAWVRSWTQEKDAATDGQHQDGGGGGEGGKPEEEAAAAGAVGCWRRRSSAKHPITTLVKSLAEQKVDKRGRSKFLTDGAGLQKTQATLRSVANLLARDDAAREALLGHSNALRILARVTERFLEDPKVATFGCWIFTNLAFADAPSAAAAGRAGGVRLAARALEVHSEHLNVLLHAAGALFALTNACGENRKEAAELNLPDRLFAVLAAHPDRQELVAYCLWVLLALLQHDGEGAVLRAALAPDRVRQIEIVRTRNHNNEEIRNAADEIFEKFVDENIFYDEVEIEEAIKLGQAQGAL